MNQKEIYVILAEAAFESVKDIPKWDKSILKIKRLEGNVGFESFYTYQSDNEIPVDTEANYHTSQAVHELYKFMSETFGANNKWNRIKFTLYRDNKIHTEYIWDQELQDEMDRYNKQK